MSQSLLQQAVEALKASRQALYGGSFPLGWNIDRVDEVLAAIQQQPESVAVWQSQCKDGTWSDCTEANARAGESYGFPCRVLYTAQPPALQQQPEPVAQHIIDNAVAGTAWRLAMLRVCLNKFATMPDPREWESWSPQQAVDWAMAAAPALQQQEVPSEPRKLWLWKNFVDGRPEYWAFDNPYPTRLDCGDPQTLGEPCGYALFKPSRDGSAGRTEEQVLQAIKRASSPSATRQQEVGNTLGVMVVGAVAPKPPCTVCGTAYEKHGSYPTCASHPYSPDGRCGHVGTFADGRFTGVPCAGAECRNGCARASGVMASDSPELYVSKHEHGRRAGQTVVAELATGRIVGVLADGMRASEELCHCDKHGIGEPGVSCGDCPTRDYKRTDGVPASGPRENWLERSQPDETDRYAMELARRKNAEWPKHSDGVALPDGGGDVEA